jgi:DHA1 family bicyclomycin/chloramphenicol resistance-like MFS transporter
MNQLQRSSLLMIPVLLALFELVIYLSNDMYLPALLAIKSDLHTSDSLVRLSLTTWFLGATMLHLIVGPISDSIGRKPVMFVGGSIFVVSSLICGITDNIVVLLIARFFQGTTVSVVAVSSYATLHEILDDIQAAKAIAMMTAITVFAPAFGPLLGGILMLTVGWQSIFYGLALVGGVIVTLLIIFLPESNPPEKRQSFIFSSILQNYRNIIFNHEFRTLTLTASMLFSGTVVWIVAGPFLIIEEFKRTPVEFGLIQALIFSGFMLGAGLVKVLTNKVGVNSLLKIGIRINVFAGCLALFLTSIFNNMLSPIVACLFLYSIGSGLTFSTFQRLAITSSPEPTGAKMAVFATVMVCFASLGSMAVSIFYNGKTSSITFIILAICAMAFLTNLFSTPSNILAKSETE